MFADHLDKRIGGEEQERTPSRNGYGEGLAEAATRDENVVALSADLTESTRTHIFAEKFPNRFVQVGITEQNMASVGAGMASMGKVPFIASYAMFSPGRNWEQIRTTIAYNNSNVKIIGAHAGVSVGPDGATHQAVEDMALMRVLPNMIVIAPADVHEARKATLAAARIDKPVYIRVGRSATPVVTTAESPFSIGKAEVMFNGNASHGSKVGLVVTGTLLHNALMAAKHLNENLNVCASVLHIPTIKPLDTETLNNFAKQFRSLVTIEEHQRFGGLGSAVAEHLSSALPTRITRLGVNDEFGQSGEPEELIAHYGLDIESIIKSAKTSAVSTG